MSRGMHNTTPREIRDARAASLSVVVADWYRRNYVTRMSEKLEVIDDLRMYVIKHSKGEDKLL